MLSALASEECLRLLLDCIEGCALYTLDSEGLVTDWNRTAEAVTGFSASDVLGKHIGIFYLPEDREAMGPQEEISLALREGRSTTEGWRRKKNGDPYMVSSVLTATRDAMGQLTGFMNVITDVTERRRKERALQTLQEALQIERERLHAAAESSMDAVFLCDAIRSETGEIEDFVFTFLNSNVEKMLYAPRQFMLGQRMGEVLPLHRERGLFDQYKQVVLTGRSLKQEITLENEQVKGAWLRVHAVKFRDGLAITIADISERKRHERRLLHMARHDALTGLPNRNVLHERVLQGMEDADRDGSRLAILMVDLDSFKQINDTLGHAAGDRVLATVAGRLKAAVRTTDSVIRIGGDEFVVVMPAIQRIGDVELCAQRILGSLRRPMLIEAASVRVTCSIGAAIYPENARSLEDLLSQADANMYAVKGNSKDDIRFLQENLSA